MCEATFVLERLAMNTASATSRLEGLAFLFGDGKLVVSMMDSGMPKRWCC